MKISFLCRVCGHIFTVAASKKKDVLLSKQTYKTGNKQVEKAVCSCVFCVFTLGHLFTFVMCLLKPFPTKIPVGVLCALRVQEPSLRVFFLLFFFLGEAKADLIVCRLWKLLFSANLAVSAQS